MQREGNITVAHGTKAGDHADVFVPLRAQACYTIIGRAKSGVNGVSLTLWDPNAKRVAELRAATDKPALSYCAQMNGSYHVQAQISGGTGGPEVGIYSLVEADLGDIQTPRRA